MKEVFLPIVGGIRHDGYKRGVVLRTDDNGMETMLPAMLWPDGRVEIIEQKIDEPPPSSRDDVAAIEFTDRELHIIHEALGALEEHYTSDGSDTLLIGDNITLEEVRSLLEKTR